MTREELYEALEICALVREVAELGGKYPKNTECIVMGPSGQIDVVALADVLDFAGNRYDLDDYSDVHVSTLADYVAECERQARIGQLALPAG